MEALTTSSGRIRRPRESRPGFASCGCYQSGEFNVKDLTQLLGQSQPRVSRHIKLLAEAGLIERYQEGSWVFVRGPADPAIRKFIDSAFP